jgi:hypothetical protein
MHAVSGGPALSSSLGDSDCCGVDTAGPTGGDACLPGLTVGYGLTLTLMRSSTRVAPGDDQAAASA